MKEKFTMSREMFKDLFGYEESDEQLKIADDEAENNNYYQVAKSTLDAICTMITE